MMTLFTFGICPTFLENFFFLILDSFVLKDTASVMSFTSSIHSSHGISGSGGGLLSTQKPPMGPKVEVVYNLLTMLFSHDRHNVSQKLLHMSANPETRSTLHQVGKLE